MALTPYCGRCHTFMSPRFTGPNAADTVWVCECPLGQEEIDLMAEGDERPFYEVIDELDEILEDTNQQVEEETRCDIFGHVWGKVGTPEPSGRTEHSFKIVWGPVKCLRCEEPAPVGKCLVHSYSVGAPFCDRCGQPMDEIQVWPEERKPEPKHECGGCNMRDAIIKEQKRLLADLVLQAPPSDTRRETERWLRLNGKIRAWGGD